MLHRLGRPRSSQSGNVTRPPRIDEMHGWNCAERSWRWRTTTGPRTRPHEPPLREDAKLRGRRRLEGRRLGLDPRRGEGNRGGWARRIHRRRQLVPRSPRCRIGMKSSRLKLGAGPPRGRSLDYERQRACTVSRRMGRGCRRRARDSRAPRREAGPANPPTGGRHYRLLTTGAGHTAEGYRGPRLRNTGGSGYAQTKANCLN